LKAIEKWGLGSKRVRDNNGWGWMDWSKVEVQQGHIEKSHWNIYLNTNNKRQDCKIGTACECVVWVLVGEKKVEWRRLKWGYMVDGLHILTCHRQRIS
jgi:hypothetical protein